MAVGATCYRAIDRFGALVDVRLSETRDVAAAKAFFRSAKAVTGVIPARVTTDGHDSYPRAIRTELDGGVKHRTNQYLRIEQDHRGIKGRYEPMRGFKNTESAARFCRAYDELRNHLYPAHAVAGTFQPPPAAIVSLPVASSHSASSKRRDLGIGRVHRIHSRAR
jgi:putative transposase